MVRMGRHITKYSFIFLLALCFSARFAMAQQNSPSNTGSWSGVIINSGCTIDEAFAEAAKCTDKVAGAKLVLYDDTLRQIYDLEPQTQALGHLGDSVTVKGALAGNTIHVASLGLLTSIGLPVGKKAPAFSARDQFGQEQTLESL